MADITNKTLALFLLGAMVVSLGSFIVSFGAFDTLTGRITGTDTAVSNFTINSSLSVVFTVDTVEFGIGSVNATATLNCTLNTSGPGMLNGASNPVSGPACLGFNASITPLRIQNQGNLNVSLNLSFNASADSFVGGTAAANSFSFRPTLNQTGACANAYLANYTVFEISANTNYSICNLTGFNTLSVNRTLNVDLGITIPWDAVPGDRRVSIVAWANS
jgi:hypothetical protein